MGKSFLVSEFKELTVENTDSNKNIKSAIGLGVVGAMFLGPVGAVAGYLLAGHNTEVTFLATLKDGQTLLAATDNETYQDISARFNRKTLLTNAIKPSLDARFSTFLLVRLENQTVAYCRK